MPTGAHPRLLETATAENAVPVIHQMSDATQRSLPSFVEVTLKAVVVHTVTYFGVGLLAFTLLDYATLFAEPEMQSWLRQTNDPIVALGPALQPLRGLLFAIACYPLRASLFGRRYGWLALWLMLVSVGVFSTFGPAPGSIEGLIYTTMPPLRQLGGLGEVLLQSLLLAVMLCYWVDHPGQRWLSWLLGTLFVVVILLSAAGFMMARAAALGG